VALQQIHVLTSSVVGAPAMTNLCENQIGRLGSITS
jgi:hypothetical protein